MANATASKKAAEQKAANKKAEKDATKEAATTEAKAPAKRTSARVTLTQTKVIEAQYDTNSKRIEELDKKLVDVLKGYEDKPEHMVAVTAQAARDDLAKAAEALVTSKESFEKIGVAMRDFFG